MAKKPVKKIRKKAPRAAKHIEPTKAQRDYETYRAAVEAPPAPPQGNVATTVNSHSVKSPAILEAFLVYLRKGYVPKRAAEAVGVSRTTFFNWRRDDLEFAAAWEQAIDEGTDLLEEAIMKRAQEGVSRPVFQMGSCVGFTQEYSDSLAAMMLQGRRPMYRKQQPDDSNNSGVTININGGLPVSVEKDATPASILTEGAPRVNVVESIEKKDDSNA